MCRGQAWLCPRFTLRLLVTRPGLLSCCLIPPPPFLQNQRRAVSHRHCRARLPRPPPSLWPTRGPVRPGSGCNMSDASAAITQYHLLWTRPPFQKPRGLLFPGVSILGSETGPDLRLVARVVGAVIKQEAMGGRRVTRRAGRLSPGRRLRTREAGSTLPPGGDAPWLRDGKLPINPQATLILHSGQAGLQLSGCFGAVSPS